MSGYEGTAGLAEQLQQPGVGFARARREMDFRGIDARAVRLGVKRGDGFAGGEASARVRIVARDLGRAERGGRAVGEHEHLPLREERGRAVRALRAHALGNERHRKETQEAIT